MCVSEDPQFVLSSVGSSVNMAAQVKGEIECFSEWIECFSEWTSDARFGFAKTTGRLSLQISG